MKKASGNLRIPSMSCKAFNGRIVTEYLADVSRMAARRTPAMGPGRKFGAWLVGQIGNNRASFPDDPKIPLQAAGLKLRGNARYFLSFALQQSSSLYPLILAILCSKDSHGTMVWLD